MKVSVGLILSEGFGGNDYISLPLLESREGLHFLLTTVSQITPNLPLLTSSYLLLLTCSNFSLCLDLIRTLLIQHLTPPPPLPLDNPGDSPNLKIVSVITVAKSLLPFKVIYSQNPRIRTWTPFGQVRGDII